MRGHVPAIADVCDPASVLFSHLCPAPVGERAQLSADLAQLLLPQDPGLGTFGAEELEAASLPPLTHLLLRGRVGRGGGCGRALRWPR